MESEGGSSAATGSSRSRSSVETPAASPYFLDSALPSDCDQGYDQHSSEEELEVINFTQPKLNTGQEKRKWSQVKRKKNTTSTSSSSSASSDDEVVGLVAAMAAPPLQFRTSPPRGTHRPCTEQQLVLQEASSPRKRHRHAAPPRPCLNFEKMQQVHFLILSFLYKQTAMVPGSWVPFYRASSILTLKNVNCNFIFALFMLSWRRKINKKIAHTSFRRPLLVILIQHVSALGRHLQR
ncbi:hypothetical protein AAG570_006624 [Ranatra chinensis]|uniref:Uncharacterized protein n=1 Tax=Ranatra chinensis TaxID=642074 RepID=A0ABD0YUM1_9HEMI